MATFSERFGSVAGTVLGVQATVVSGITDISITGVKMTLTGTEPKRTAFVTLTIDAEDFEIDLELMDESFNTVTLTGNKLSTPAPL